MNFFVLMNKLYHAVEDMNWNNILHQDQTNGDSKSGYVYRYKSFAGGIEFIQWI